MTDRPQSPSQRLPPLAGLAAFFVGYLALQEVAFALLQPPTWIPLVWPPAGLATAALLLTKWSRWPQYLGATALASLAGNLVHGQPTTASILYAGYNMIVPLAGAASYRFLGSRSLRLETMADVRNLLLGPCLLAPMATSVLGIVVLVWADVLPAGGFLREWEHHWVGQALGVLAIVPLALSWPREPLLGLVRRDTFEAAAWLAAITAGAWWSLGTSETAAGMGFILELTPFLLLFWVATRYGVFAGAAGATLATAVVIHSIGSFGLVAPAGLTDDEVIRLLRAALLAIFLPTIGLAVTVQERTRAQVELAESRRQEIERLSKIDAMRREFVNRAAHELSTPLTPLRLMSRSLAEGMLGQLDPEQAESINILERNVVRLERLAHELAVAGKLQSDRLDLRREAVDLADVAREATEAYQAQARTQEVTLELQVPEQPLPVVGDRDRLCQVFSNLISNAIRFTPPNGRVNVRAWKEDAQFHVEVSDTGPGLTEEEAQECFEPFIQPVEAPPGTKPGTGLGLHISRGLAVAHGGTVACIHPGKGTGARFRMTLPVTQEAVCSTPR